MMEAIVRPSGSLCSRIAIRYSWIFLGHSFLKTISVPPRTSAAAAISPKRMIFAIQGALEFGVGSLHVLLSLPVGVLAVVHLQDLAVLYQREAALFLNV